jgi:prepilin-type N-terminal cleavage/methylation domain-containing protein
MFLRTSLSRGFTLLELLVVVAVIGILSSLLLPALARGKQKAKHINELNAAKQLILAWQLYADEHEDAVLLGYISEDIDNTGLPSPIRDRYPWRLAPQLGGSFRAIYVNESRRFLDEAERMSHDAYVYRASLYPSLGYNSVFIGGDEQKFNPELAGTTYGLNWLVSRASQIRQPSELIAFASARSRPGGNRDEFGHYVVHPPYLKSRHWEEAFSMTSEPSKFGYVHPRWSGRAVAAMTDGHAETLNQTDLQDMRRWCNIANRPDWTLSALP